MNGSVLSNRDIEKYYGKEIFIYPYKSDNMKGGSTYNLTASEYAYYCDNDGRKCYAVDKGVIRIPAHKTVLIQTEESIYVSDRICGTYHSKVKLVSDGLSHIGTTLDPKYFGTSKIAIQNTTCKEQKINVGSTFVSLMLYRFKGKSTARHDNGPGREDVLPVDLETMKRINNKQRIKLKEWFDKPWRRNCEDLIEITKDFKNKTNRGKKVKILNKISFITDCLLIPIILLIVIKFFKKFLIYVISKSIRVTIFMGIISLLMFVKKGFFNLIESIIHGDY